MGLNGIYVFPSSNQTLGIFQHAMFDQWKVAIVCLEPASYVSIVSNGGATNLSKHVSEIGDSHQ